MTHRALCRFLATGILLLLLSARPADAAFGWGSSPQYSCPATAEVCTLRGVTLATERDIEQARFEGVHDPLLIESGRIPHFSPALLAQLGSAVSELTLHRLAIVKLSLRANFRLVSAVGNEIDELRFDEDARDGGPPYALLILQLSHNRLTEVPPLGRFGKLRTLELDHNLLVTLDMASFARPAQLRKLSLAHNRLHTVTSPPAPATVPLVLLKSLSLAGNQLAALDVRTWEMDSLAELNVSGNSLARLDGGLTPFPALTTLALAGNQLYCEWLMQETALAAAALTLDADAPGRCEAERMTRHRERYCCALVGNDGGANNVFAEKWAQLATLGQLIGALNASLANVSSSSSEPSAECEARVTELVRVQDGQRGELKELQGRVRDHQDTVSTLEADLGAQVGALRTELNASWTRTGDDWPPSANASSSTAAASARDEGTLGKLRDLLETTRKQLNRHREEYYQQTATLDAYGARIDGLEKDVQRAQEHHRGLKARIGEVEKRSGMIYEFLKERKELYSAEED